MMPSGPAGGEIRGLGPGGARDEAIVAASREREKRPPRDWGVQEVGAIHGEGGRRGRRLEALFVAGWSGKTLPYFRGCEGRRIILMVLGPKPAYCRARNRQNEPWPNAGASSVTRKHLRRFECCGTHTVPKAFASVLRRGDTLTLPVAIETSSSKSMRGREGKYFTEQRYRLGPIRLMLFL